MQVRAAFVSSGILAAMLVATAPMSLAQPQQYPDQPAYQAADQATDPPGRVARISVLRGDVSLEPAGVQQFSQAEINYPLTNGDRIYTDVGALAELQTAGLSVRLANAADLTVSTLTDQVAQFGLEQGSIRVRTSDLSAPDGTQGVVEIDTPNGTILVVSAGDIRVDAYPQNDTTVVTVTSGQVQVQGQNLNQTLGPNESIRLVGNPPAAQYLRLLPPDALDQFDQERDQQLQRDYAAEQDFVGPEMIGADELSQYGDWSASPDYGDVWYPRGVDVSWTPYQNGHWAWVAPWGWTWVEAEPWGFAPFHYGRWANFGGRWGWVPGPPQRIFGRPVRPVYSPALVAFVGGPQFSISLGFGGGAGAGVTAWFPLGPRESYTPWYHASPTYVNRVNVTNIYNRNVTEVRNNYNNRTTNVYERNDKDQNFQNRSVATTAVTQKDFAAGRRVDQAQRIRMDDKTRAQINQAPVLPHPLVTPSAAIAAPQAPARVLPPNQQRPQWQNRGDQSRNTSQPAGNPPVLGGGNPGNSDRGRPVQPSPSVPVQPSRPASVTTEPTRVITPTTANPPQPVNPNRNIQPQNFPPVRNQEPLAAQPATPRTAVPVQPNTPQQLPQPQARPWEQPRPLVNKVEPQPQTPSFEQQQKAIEHTDPGRPLGPQQLNNLRQGRDAGPAQQAEPVQHPGGKPQAAPAPQPAPKTPPRATTKPQ